MKGVLGHNSATLDLMKPNEMNCCYDEIMPQVQDESLDQLTCSPMRYHCATAIPLLRNSSQ